MLKLETWNVENTKMKMLIRGFFSGELSVPLWRRRGRELAGGRSGARAGGWAWRRSMRLRGGSDTHGEEGGREEEKFRVE